MAQQCEFCWGTFQSDVKLRYHQNNCKMCQNFKYTLFICRKCGYMTRGIKNINTHNKNCQFTTTAVDDLIEELQNRVHELEEEVTACKAKLNGVKATSHVEELLHLEQ